MHKTYPIDSNSNYSFLLSPLPLEDRQKYVENKAKPALKTHKLFHGSESYFTFN
jgi:hypothetical protein